MTSLECFRSGYESLLSLLDRRHRMRPETVLSLIQETASYAMRSHPGRFADGTIENIVAEIGMSLDDAPLPQELQGQPCFRVRGESQRRVLHVVSTVMEIGGHTRTLLNWIKTDPDSRHNVLLTDQKSIPVPAWLVETVNRSGGAVIDLPEQLGPLSMARLLRSVARSGADMVILHHGGHDVVPILAFASHNLPPVAVLNHADHIFWLGSSITDIVVNQREVGAQLSAKRRFSRKNTVLPIPLEPLNKIDRIDARRQLRIPVDQLVLLSVGRAFKYFPTQRHHFLRTVNGILDRVPTAHAYIVGLSEAEAARFPNYVPHPRVHLCGLIPDPSFHRAAADLYLESFPFGSSTAMLEAAQVGLPSVLQYEPSCDLLTTNHGLEKLLTQANNEEEYIEQVCELATNIEGREELGANLERHIRTHHTGDGWRRLLGVEYAHIEALTHLVNPIPSSACESQPDDRALSDWHMALRKGRAESGGLGVRPEVISASYWARQKGDYRGAFELLWRNLRSGGIDRQILASAAKVPIHWVARVFGLTAPLGSIGSARVVVSHCH